MFVAYLRVSTENQKNEGTISLQKREIEDYCQQNRIIIGKYFADEGISGSKELHNRPGLAELFEFIEENHVEGVVIWKLDRLARDLYLQETLIRKLDKLNVRLISTKEIDLDSKDPMRKAFRQFMGIVSELEKEFIAMRLSAGRINKSKKGKYAGGCPAFGFDADKKELMVNDDQAKVVRKIFYLRKRKKLSLQKIADQLNRKNIESARGGIWHKGSVKNILENKVYRGYLNYKGNVSKRMDLVLV